MKSLIAIFLCALVGTSICTAQNFYHVKLGEKSSNKDECIALLDQLTNQFGIENSTFSIRMTALPKGTNAIIEYSKVDATGRHNFLIALNRFHRRESITTSLIHEMVHAKQYYHEQLIRYDRTAYKWEGTHYRNVSHIEHHRRPWEIEAHELVHTLKDDYSQAADLTLLNNSELKKKVFLARRGHSTSWL